MNYEVSSNIPATAQIVVLTHINLFVVGKCSKELDNYKSTKHRIMVTAH